MSILLYQLSVIQQLKSVFRQVKQDGKIFNLDLALGIIITALVGKYWLNSSVDVLVVFEDLAEIVASYLERLINELMNNPVGLKLNGPLSKALGAFFLHHVHLWRLYILSVQSLMSALLIGFSFMGLFGASVLVAGIDDLLVFITIHCYIFYIYAARLYNLNVQSVGALWRMFRGKKYNPIREQVDSGHFETDQIIVGMLFFMIAGFVLPTTAVYYFVFLALRLWLKTMSFLLRFCRDVLHNLPVVSLTRTGKSRRPEKQNPTVEPETSIYMIGRFLSKVLIGEVV